jgi:hypothetical protein
MTLEAKARAAAKKARLEWDSLAPDLQEALKRAYRKDAPSDAPQRVSEALKAYARARKSLEGRKVVLPPPSNEFAEAARKGILDAARAMYPHVTSLEEATVLLHMGLLAGLLEHERTSKALYTDLRRIAKDLAYWQAVAGKPDAS